MRNTFYVKFHLEENIFAKMISLFHFQGASSTTKENNVSSGNAGHSCQRYTMHPAPVPSVSRYVYRKIVGILITVRRNDFDTQNPTIPNSLFYISSTFLSAWKEKRPKETRLDKRLDPLSHRLFRGLLNSFVLTASLRQAAIQISGKSSLERDDGSYTGVNVVKLVSYRL